MPDNFRLGQVVSRMGQDVSLHILMKLLKACASPAPRSATEGNSSPKLCQVALERQRTTRQEIWRGGEALPFLKNILHRAIQKALEELGVSNAFSLRASFLLTFDTATHQ